MTKIQPSTNTSGNAGSSSISQSDFQSQIKAQVDALRQLVGNAEIQSGATTNNPLNTPYVLYVDPYIGQDTFVGSSYSTSGSAVERIEMQRLECGYTQARPFKTINRAIIEAGLITAKSFYSAPLTNNDLVSIVLMPGVHTVMNGTGTSVSSWGTPKTPSDAELKAFNPTTLGGVLLPRGVSLCALDLRKTILRPDTVPTAADEASDASNRRAIFKVTGTGYYFGMTFMDKVGVSTSHHLLDCFQFASQTELNEFYAKIRTAFATNGNLVASQNPLVFPDIARESEYQIVGPQPLSNQGEATDTTLSASPYIFNCSIRSNYGLCGIYADGSRVDGFRSIVVAQFTGVSLQKDLSCWQRYSSGSWGSVSTYSEYISTDPDDVRMKPTRRSFHIRAVNNAVIQEVSVFAIGQGVHHWTQSGGEITITNSNSNFGGCAAISEGYRSAAFTGDSGWNVSRIRVANNLAAITGNVQRIYLGTVEAVGSSTITLTTALNDSTTTPGVPDVVARDGYTLRDQTRVWVENPSGADWSTTFATSAWSAGSGAILNTRAALVSADGTAASDAVGKRVYIRRLVDTRTVEQRRYSLKLSNTSAAVRPPVRDYVIQTTPGSGNVTTTIPTSKTLVVGESSRITMDGVVSGAQITLRRANTAVTWTSGTFYRQGETVQRANKHYVCIRQNSDANFDAAKWAESYVHTPEAYAPEDFHKTTAPLITFDSDTSSDPDSTTLGYNLSTVWSTDADIQAQYRSAADYRGLHLLLTTLGLSSADAHTVLLPRAEASRDRNPVSSLDSKSLSGGIASDWANWPVQFRRPSTIRLFGHAWEWSGYLNYTKAIPTYQKDLSPQNAYSYYFTNVDGGRVYASGFNEEGYQVTPRGLEDITTGEVLEVENLGASDISPITSLNNVTLKGTTTIQDTLVLNPSSASYSSAMKATTDRLGVGEIASIDDLNTTIIQTNTSPQPRFVTPEGLEYWRREKKLVTRSTETVTLYVVPDNAVSTGGSYSFDGVAGVALTLSPTRTGDDLFNNPPTSTATAVQFDNAVQYANALYGPTETVIYRLANGPYYNTVRSFAHIADIRGAVTQFAFNAEQQLTDFTTSVAPRKDVVSIINNGNIPMFATPVTLNTSSTTKRLNYYASPVALDLKYGGSISGLAWLSVAQTLAKKDLFPDSIYLGISTYRQNNGTARTLKELINAHLAAEAGTGKTYTSSWQIDKFPSTPTIKVAIAAISELVITDCVFGAKAPGYGVIGYGGISTVISIQGPANLSLSGIYLLGNTYLDSVTIPSGGPVLASSGVAFYGCRNCHSFIASRESSSGPRDCTIAFPFRSEHTNSPLGDGIYDRNYDGNCIHILDSNGKYGLAANVAATGVNAANRGATFAYLIGELSPGSRFYTGGYPSYQVGFTNASKHHGFAGVFGNESLAGTGKGPKGVSGALDPISFYRYASYNENLWQQAGTGNCVTYDSTRAATIDAAYGPGKQVDAFGASITINTSNPLNIDSSVFFRGLDTESGQVVGGSFTGTTTFVATPRTVLFG